MLKHRLGSRREDSQCCHGGEHKRPRGSSVHWGQCEKTKLVGLMQGGEVWGEGGSLRSLRALCNPAHQCELASEELCARMVS